MVAVVSIQTGVISNKNSVDWNKTLLYSFQLEGSQRWWRTGKIEIPHDVGTRIQFEESNSQVNTDTVKVVTASDTTSSSPREQSSNGSAPTAGLSREQYWSNREARDIEAERSRRIAAARADATRIVVAALQTDHLPHAANTTKAKKWELLRGYVREITKEFLEDEE